MRPPVSIVFIRDQAEQVTGSGCCGKLAGDDALTGCERAFAESRQTQRQIGLLHRMVRRLFPPVDGREQVGLAAVDPRNQLYLVPKLWSDVWHYRPGLAAGLRTMLQLFSLPAVVVNGRVMAAGGKPLDPDALCHAVAEILSPAPHGGLAPHRSTGLHGGLTPRRSPGDAWRRRDGG